VPELTLFQFRSMDLVAIPVEAPGIVRPIFIVRQKNRTLSVAAQGMLELVEASLRSVGTGQREIPGIVMNAIERTAQRFVLKKRYGRPHGIRSPVGRLLLHLRAIRPKLPALIFEQGKEPVITPFLDIV
jgi:hypothetical protein